MTRLTLRNTYLYNRIFHTKCIAQVNNSSRSSEHLSSNVRKKFLDYFIKENNHKYVRSSPIMPYCDPTVAFVNAGMNQFKSIFLGHQEPLFNRVANSQKCVRVGGKHNDVSMVGLDGYHHTFFEMLGNWSFGNYFKKEACEMAWNLLTGPYGLHPSSLYVTYFAGDANLNLMPDLECKEIWRSIGIADDHIVGFGCAENFWEMGATGPCGPCTEIHIDHLGVGSSRARDVNRNLPDLTELWNLVFIQYNRNANGSITALPKCHIDTGMGLERLTAVLQGKKSNYDTDIFSTLFDCIQQECKGLPEYQETYGTKDVHGINTAYRILADHSRMITACLADGMIPEQNQKLRRIIRKSMLLSETIFRKEKGLLNCLATVIIEDLGKVYTEMQKQSKDVHQIIEYEEEVYRSIRSSATKSWTKIIEKEPKLQSLSILEMPGLVAAYHDITSSGLKAITPQSAFKLYDTFGLDEPTIKSLCVFLNMHFDPEDLKTELENARARSKQGFAPNYNNLLSITQVLHKTGKIPKTDDSFKYKYKSFASTYVFDSVKVELLIIVREGKIVQEIEAGSDCYLILNQTNLYSEAGGQISDKGHIEFKDGKIYTIEETYKLNGYIFHKGVLLDNNSSKLPLKVGETGNVFIDAEGRSKCMANHTATHLLNAALKKVASGPTCQKSTRVCSELLSFDVGIYGNKLSVEDIEEVEHLICQTIKKGVDVQVKHMNSQEFLEFEYITLVPGEVYPEVGIRVIEIEDKDCFSREPCCGTHVWNTADIKDFCIIHFKSLGRSTTSISAVTGECAVLAHKNAEQMLNDCLELQKNINDSSFELNSDVTISELKDILHNKAGKEIILPSCVRAKCLQIITDVNKQLRGAERDSLRQFIDLEMNTVMEANRNKSKKNIPFIVHFLGCSSILDSIPLQRATKTCSNLPIIVVSYTDEIVKARCCVPKNLVNIEFNAELWMKNTVAKMCKSTISTPKGFDNKLVCNMKAKRVNKLEWESVLENSITSAKLFAENHL